MSYEKHTWENGETITADKLNHMEDGVSMGEKIIIAKIQPTSYTEGTCNFTIEELYNFIRGGYIVLFSMAGWISTSPCYVSSVNDVLEITGKGIAINPVNNALSAIEANYGENASTGQIYLHLNTTDYVQAPTTG